MGCYPLHGLIDETPMFKMITQKHILRIILNHLPPKDVFKLERLHPAFILFHPLYTYYNQIEMAVDIYNRTGLRGSQGDRVHDPYHQNDPPHESIEYSGVLTDMTSGRSYPVNSRTTAPRMIHHRDELLATLNLTEDTLGDRFECNNEEFSQLVFVYDKILKPDELSEDYTAFRYNNNNNLQFPNQYQMTFRIPTRGMIFDGFYLEYPSPEDLEKSLEELDHIDYEIGSQCINREYPKILKLHWRNFHQKPKNLLPIMFQNINYQQPVAPLTFFHEKYLKIHFVNPPTIIPKIYLTGYAFDDITYHQQERSSGESCCFAREKIIMQTQFTGWEQIYQKLQISRPIYFNHCVYSLIIMLSDNSIPVETITLRLDSLTIGPLNPTTLSQDLPSSLGLQPDPNFRYYLINFNSFNPFEYNLESFKEGINFSRIDRPKYEIEFKEEYTGTVEVYAISTNISRIVSNMYGVMFAS